MACGCQKAATASAFVVKIPGQPERVVSSEQAAQTLTKGVRGALYTAKK